MCKFSPVRGLKAYSEVKVSLCARVNAALDRSQLSTYSTGFFMPGKASTVPTEQGTGGPKNQSGCSGE